jgi:hypothetical protein
VNVDGFFLETGFLVGFYRGVLSDSNRLKR